jgi:hypothetical protein
MRGAKHLICSSPPTGNWQEFPNNCMIGPDVCHIMAEGRVLVLKGTALLTGKPRFKSQRRDPEQEIGSF